MTVFSRRRGGGGDRMRPSLSFFIGPNTIQLDVLPMHDSICTDSLLRAEQNKLNLHDSRSREMLLQISSSKVRGALLARARWNFTRIAQRRTRDHVSCSTVTSPSWILKRISRHAVMPVSLSSAARRRNRR